VFKYLFACQLNQFCPLINEVVVLVIYTITGKQLSSVYSLHTLICELFWQNVSLGFFVGAQSTWLSVNATGTHIASPSLMSMSTKWLPRCRWWPWDIQVTAIFRILKTIANTPMTAGSLIRDRPKISFGFGFVAENINLNCFAQFRFLPNNDRWLSAKFCFRLKKFCGFGGVPKVMQ